MSHARTWRILTVACALFLLLVIYFADTNSIPVVFHALCDFPGGDKVGHFGLYGMFAFLGAKAFRRPLRVGPLTIPAGALPAVILATVEETSQFIFPNRSPDLLDLGAGFAGIVLAVLAVRVGPLRNRKVAPSNS